jgi:hypothetical protein
MNGSLAHNALSYQMINRVYCVPVSEIHGLRFDSMQTMPFLRLYSLPPRYSEPDLVSARHENMPAIRKSIGPNA